MQFWAPTLATRGPGGWGWGWGSRVFFCPFSVFCKSSNSPLDSEQFDFHIVRGVNVRIFWNFSGPFSGRHANFPPLLSEVISRR